MDKKPLVMPKPMPSTEADRMAEATELLKKIDHTDMVRLTSWEMELVDDLKDGVACSRIRLKELRDAVERIENERAQKKGTE